MATATLQPSAPTQNPSHTFLDNKAPLLPRQSTSDVLSFTKIIRDRLAPGQNVWEYFSPAPVLAPAPAPSPPSPPAMTDLASATPPLSPASPVSPSFGSFSLFGGRSKRQSVLFDIPAPALTGSDSTTESGTDSGVLSPSSSQPLTTATTTPAPTPRLQKRKSFAQSLRSMLSLSQLLSSTTKGNLDASQPPHYNIVVLGSDSAPLASTLYKMSSLLPSTNKISHYQEISGFFVAYFRSNGSFSCSPKTLADRGSDVALERSRACGGEDEVKSRRSDDDNNHNNNNNNSQTSVDRASQETEAAEDGSSITLVEDGSNSVPVAMNASSNASLSVHAFSLDTTWPVPRMLAQTFWFPHAHGIIYIVDATRKNDPRGMDHLISARQFLSSLMTDPHFKRRDIPVVVFANKAGMDQETCYRVDEIADILGCEEWDDVEVVATGEAKTVERDADRKHRPWCVKSTRSDGTGEGLRESVEWLKSRMSEIWKSA